MQVQSSLPSKFAGIIQLSVNLDENQALQTLIESLINKDNRWVQVTKTHCTLMHQKYPKLHETSDGLRGDKALKELFKSGFEMPPIILELGEVQHCQELDTSRESLIVPVLNIDEVRNVRDEILLAAGLTPEQFVASFDDDEFQRTFHLSLCNLTGNPGDSPAFPNSDNTTPYGG